MNCSIALLPCNGRDAWRDAHNITGNTTAEEAAMFAHDIGVSTFIPMHHDLFRINSCSEVSIKNAAQKACVDVLLLKVMESIEL